MNSSTLKRRDGMGRYIENKIKYAIDANGCWNCISHRPSSTGYPITSRNGKNIKVMRIMFKKYKHTIPKGMHMRHTCDNRKCINPNHLLLGTNAENTRDKVIRNRQIRGITVPSHRLTEQEVREIRKSDLKGRELAKKYHVGEATISQVVNNKSWVHLK